MDFSYEVSRSIGVCQSAILLVDGSQGIQAQTISNLFMALDAGLDILPILNKYDLAISSNEYEQILNQTIAELANLLLIGDQKTDDQILKISAKSGLGTDLILPKILQLPPPTGSREKPLKLVIFDSWYDIYRGVICTVSLIDGKVKAGDRIQSVHTRKDYEVMEVFALRFFYFLPFIDHATLIVVMHIKI